jgi:hypothetical protein
MIKRTGIDLVQANKIVSHLVITIEIKYLGDRRVWPFADRPERVTADGFT